MKPKMFIVSHAPFWHNGSRISTRSYTILGATLPAVLLGITQYGGSALAVVCLAVSSAILWELLLNRLMNRPVTVGDGNAALIGMLLAMLLPATCPWWAVLTGTFIAVVIGKQIFGGIGANPFNPAVTALAILTVSWPALVDFDTMLVNYAPGFDMRYPLTLSKNLEALGASAVAGFTPMRLLMGQQSGGIGATFGLGLLAGGLFMMIRNVIRWEIALTFLAGVLATALAFHMADGQTYAGPTFHLLTGYTLIGAFFLATEDSSSPVNRVPMLVYGLGGGILTVLIRNIGDFTDGVLYAVLLMNLVNPLLDKIRPKALGKVA